MECARLAAALDQEHRHTLNGDSITPDAATHRNRETDRI